MAKKSFLETAANLAHHAKAIADIIKGALSGGWTGAALAAVKHYFPQIMVISFVVFLLPVIIFYSLPAIIFDTIFGGGEMSADEKIYSVYGDYELMMESHMGELAGEFYQGIENIELPNKTIVYNGYNQTAGEAMNMYWFAAIHAVYLNNEVPTKEQINEFTENLYTYSISETETSKIVKKYEPDAKTGITPPPHTTVYINRTLTITYSDPYDAMNRLGFEKSDIAWAESMYSVMTSVDLETEKTLLTGISFTNPLPLNWRSAVTSEFGYRTDPVNGGADNHTGIDLQAPTDTDIMVAADGKVVSVVENTTGYGFYVKMSHFADEMGLSINSGIETMYCHCDEIYVKVGDEVKQGDVIAAIGSTGKTTGPHLHWEIRVNGKAINPRPYLP